MTVYDRSWYGRLLVEVVEGFIDQKTAKRSAKEIVEFERMLTNDRVTLVKLWLHISDKEQLRRFNDRADHPLKHWKLTPDDWRNRDKRKAYLKQLEFMVDTTDQPHAHWTSFRPKISTTPAPRCSRRLLTAGKRTSSAATSRCRSRAPATTCADSTRPATSGTLKP